MAFTVDRPDCFFCGFPKTAHNASDRWLDEEFIDNLHLIASIPRRWMMECQRLMQEETRIITHDANLAQLEFEDLERRANDIRKWKEGLQ